MARKGQYAEAIAALERAKDLYGTKPAARDIEKQILLYQGLREADLKQKLRRANEDLILIGRRLQAHHSASGHYPVTLAEIGPRGSLPTVDPWGRPYRYKPGANGGRYRLGCLGADGVAGGTGDNQDLLVDTGEFSKELSWEDK